MKIISLLTRIATIGVLLASVGLALNALALGLFAATVATFVLLIAAGDYARKPGYSLTLTPALLHRREVMPLAA